MVPFNVEIWSILLSGIFHESIHFCCVGEIRSVKFAATYSKGNNVSYRRYSII